MFNFFVEDARRHIIQELAGAERGKLVIGAIPTITPYFLPAHLASFARRFPGVQVSVVEDLTNELLNRMQDGTVDLALLALPVPAGNYLCQELFRETALPCATGESPTGITARSLSQADCE